MTLKWAMVNFPTNYDTGDEWDVDLDNYESRYGSVVDSDEDTSEGAQEACNR